MKMVIYMKFNDAIVGFVLFIISVAILLYVQTFPSMPLSVYGPATFPKLLGWGLLACSIYLVVSGLRTRKTIPWMVLDTWTKMPVRWRRFFSIPLAIIGYIILSQTLGYVLYMFIALVMLLMDYTGGRWKLALLAAGIFSLSSYYLFGGALMVPLPRGLLWFLP